MKDKLYALDNTGCPNDYESFALSKKEQKPFTTPPPCHTHKGPNILFMVSDTNLLQNELFDFYASRRSSSTAWQATQISSPTFRSFGIS